MSHQRTLAGVFWGRECKHVQQHVPRQQSLHTATVAQAAVLLTRGLHRRQNSAAGEVRDSRRGSLRTSRMQGPARSARGQAGTSGWRAPLAAEAVDTAAAGGAGGDEAAPLPAAAAAGLGSARMQARAPAERCVQAALKSARALAAAQACHATRKCAAPREELQHRA